jgi:hypothetical protein
LFLQDLIDRTYEITLQRHRRQGARVDAMVSTAETETEKEKEQEEATASSEELPIMPWATSVAR